MNNNGTCGKNLNMDCFYAVKVLRRRRFDQRLQDEPMHLKRFIDKNHQHLIRLLLTFYHEDTLHLVFPWADGNLLDIWCDVFPGADHPPRDYRLATWIVREMSGLADGLKMIHESIIDDSNTQGLLPETVRILGRHGDLKPENILWFPDRGDTASSRYPTGVLKISDFGLVDFHTLDTVEVSADSVGRTDTYRAPECDTKERVSQAYDMWSLGCVLLQFSTWYMRGWRGVEEFVEERVADSTEVVPGDTFFNVKKQWGWTRIHGLDQITTRGRVRAVNKLSVHKVGSPCLPRRAQYSAGCRERLLMPICVFPL
jgi:serine/threonine protein kinase